MQLAIVVLCCFACSRAETGLRYPGNGIPFLSGDKSIHELNRELEQLAVSNASCAFTNDGFFFDNMSDIIVPSSQALVGERYSLAIPVSIERGICVIAIGDIEYVVESNGLVVNNGGLEIFRYSGDALTEIILEVFETSSSTRFRLGNRQTEVVPVDIDTPAPIQIRFYRECSGKLGPWRWLRGYA
ncbi:MAG: hypothetical protein GY835_16610 [bacterium]|nr:hypothetical protein [bacterium]